MSHPAARGSCGLVVASVCWLAVEVRRARVSDVSSIRQLVDIYVAARILLDKPTVTLYEDVQDFWVAEDEGRLVGCGALHVMWEDLAEIRTVAVAPDFQGHGAGHAIVEQLLETARWLGVERVFVLTFEVGFFAQHGFVEIDGAPVEPVVYEELRRSIRRGCGGVPRPRARQAEHARQHPHAPAPVEDRRALRDAARAREEQAPLRSHHVAGGVVFIDGEFVAPEEARMSIFDYGFTWSDCVYDVTSVWRGWFFKLDDHLERFERSCEGFPAHASVRPQRGPAAILAECVDRAGLEDAYVKIEVTRGLTPNQSRDLRLAENRFTAYAIPYVWIWGEEKCRENSASLHLCRRFERVSSKAIDQRFKNYNRADLVQGRLDAYDAGCDDAVLVSADGALSEGFGWNILLVKDGKVATPDWNVLEGRTRDAVEEICRDEGVPYEFRPRRAGRAFRHRGRGLRGDHRRWSHAGRRPRLAPGRRRASRADHQVAPAALLGPASRGMARGPRRRAARGPRLLSCVSLRARLRALTLGASRRRRGRAAHVRSPQSSGRPRRA